MRLPIARLAVVALLPSLPAAAQTAAVEYPFESQLTKLIPLAIDLEAVDVDRDGHLDLVGASRSTDSLVWLPNLGLGTIHPDNYGTPRQLIGPMTGPSGDPLELTGFGVRDLNGDGLDDYVVTTSGADFTAQAFYVEGVALGQFRDPVQVFDSSTDIGSRLGDTTEFVDFDGDGDLDVIIANERRAFFGCEPAFLENLGGALAPWPLAPLLSSPGKSFAPGDLDGDGDMDIAIASDRPAWLRNDGGTLVEVPLGFILGSIAGQVRVRDADQDGDLDIYICGDEESVVLENTDGAGTFAPGPILFAAAQYAQWIDLDHDGDLDLVNAEAPPPSAPQYQATWHENLDGYSLGPAQVLSTSATKRPVQTKLSDLDGDGLPEMLFVAESGRVRVLPGQAAPALALGSTPVEITYIVRDPRQLGAADVDGDGDLDVVVASRNSGVQVLVQGTASAFSQRIEAVAPGERFDELVADDLDGDGRIDFVLATQGRDLFLARGQAGLTWTTSAFAPAFNAATNPVAIDLNQDGLKEIVVAELSTGLLVAFDQVGPGVFSQSPRTLVNFPNPLSLEVGDINGDGLPDLLLTSFPPQARYRYFAAYGQGNGLLSLATLAATGVIPGPARLADVDGDSHLDLAWVNAPLALQCSFNGPGGLSQPVDLAPLPSNVRGLTVAQLNSDGRADFILRSRSFNDPTGLYRLLSNGAVGYGPLASLPGQARGGGFTTTADLDGDGDQEVLSLSVWENSVRVFFSQFFTGVGTSECGPAVPNSTGAPSGLSAVGSTDLADRSLVVRAADLPPFATTLFLGARAGGFFQGPGGSLGNLCLSGPIGRFIEPGDVGPSTAVGTAELRVSVDEIPQPNGAASVMAGETWRFQAWYRDSIQGQPASNFTDAIAVTFQ